MLSSGSGRALGKASKGVLGSERQGVGKTNLMEKQQQKTLFNFETRRGSVPAQNSAQAAAWNHNGYGSCIAFALTAGGWRGEAGREGVNAGEERAGRCRASSMPSIRAATRSCEAVTIESSTSLASAHSISEALRAFKRKRWKSAKLGTGRCYEPQRLRKLHPLRRQARRLEGRGREGGGEWRRGERGEM